MLEPEPFEPEPWWDPVRLDYDVCAIRVVVRWPGRLALLGLPLGGAVGDQPGDRQEGLVEVLSSSEAALETPGYLPNSTTGPTWSVTRQAGTR